MKNLFGIFGKKDNSEIVSKTEILNIVQHNIQMELLWKQK